MCPYTSLYLYIMILTKYTQQQGINFGQTTFSEFSGRLFCSRNRLFPGIRTSLIAANVHVVVHFIHVHVSITFIAGASDDGKHSCLCQQHFSHMLRQVYVQTGLCSGRSMFRQVYVQTGLCSGRYNVQAGIMFRQVNV